MSSIQYQIIVMFAIMAVGYLCGKTKIITKDVNRGLSSLSLYVVNPLVTFCSYQMGYSREIAANLGGTFLIAIVAFAMQILLSSVFVGKKNKECSIERLSVMLSNCSYIGIPLVQSVYGKEGVIYLTAYVTVFHLVTWTYGVFLMSGERSLKKALRNFVSPVIIAVSLGLVCFFGNITIPDIALQPMSSLGNMNTPLAMLIAGSTLASTDLKAAVVKWRVYYITVLKLIIVPLGILLAVFKATALGVSGIVINVVMIAASCPTATIVTMFSHRYERNSVYASEIFAVCTLASVVSLPFVLWVASLLVV